MNMTHTGVLALARETGYSAASVSKKMTQGKSPDQIRAEAAKAGLKPVILVKTVRSAAGLNASGKAAPVPASGHSHGHSNGSGSNGSNGSGVSTGSVSGTGTKAEKYYDAQARKESALADMHELKYREAVGELIPVGMLNTWFSGCIVRARDILLNVGPELRDRLAQETDPVKCDELVTFEIRRALNELAEYGHTPGTDNGNNPTNGDSSRV